MDEEKRNLDSDEPFSTERHEGSGETRAPDLEVYLDKPQACECGSELWSEWTITEIIGWDDQGPIPGPGPTSNRKYVCSACGKQAARPEKTGT